VLHSRHGQGRVMFSPAPCPDRPCGPPSLLAEGSFPGGQRGRVVELSTDLHLVPKLGIRGALSPLTHTSSCNLEASVKKEYLFQETNRLYAGMRSVNRGCS